MKKLSLILLAGLFFFSVNAQDKKADTAKTKSKGIVGQDSTSRHNADKKKASQATDQNRKREHKKNMNEK